MLFFGILLFFLQDTEAYHFTHGCYVQKRIEQVASRTKVLNFQLHKTKKVERRILRNLDQIYADLKTVTSREDKAYLAQQVDALQKQLQKTRLTKRTILRKMRNVTDNLSGAEREKIVRQNRLEHYVTHHKTNIYSEFEGAQNNLLRLENIYAVRAAKKISTYYAKIAYKNYRLRGITKSKKLKKLIRKTAKKTFLAVYKKATKIIEKETLRLGDVTLVENVLKRKIERMIQNAKFKYQVIKHKKSITKLIGKELAYRAARHI
ncbi:hypothetical protein EIN_282130 [Entamoeba invadens IP1]|uniref:Uncharacterized protein n=1 Tax=Entamoeba invadens IP1 TaxID=370355 RepID=A0A0A1TX58_ENTIV|nr:hypothetical protein EIN_282130 [Entamoeba invadens IP1]ELP85842.1 hypothetical protein EIN_282130 [Entamoeba invadens IP1]|eukprot:XP_004185188.1 hypothetical protein EIN_282130 [Entamoeba invadens IP1]